MKSARPIAASTGPGRSSTLPTVKAHESPGFKRHAAATVGNGVQDRADEVIAYTRREPATALTMAAAVGVLVGLAMAIGGFSGKGWLAPRNRKQNVMARLTGLRWTGFHG